MARMSPLAARYLEIRQATVALTKPLAIEDWVVQAMPDASPVKWHLAHTSWFFETLVLAATEAQHRPFHEGFGFLFNSYYEALGARHARPDRGRLSRPTVAEVTRYREDVDARMLATLANPISHKIAATIELGLNHEQQHQELLITDLKSAFGQNPLLPAYHDERAAPSEDPGPLRFIEGPAGLGEMGAGGDAFAFDNERPRHTVYRSPFLFADRLVTNGEYADFINDNGYLRPELWLSEGWAQVRSGGWKAPLYWSIDGAPSEYTLAGAGPIDEHAPVCHISYYEADAYARWAKARLPTESEWEAVAAEAPVEGNFADSGLFCPRGSGVHAQIAQLYGDTWEWTQSAYSPYPGFVPIEGPAQEYNGKFMINQQVLRGGSCATPRSHIRLTYRNFFPPQARWQFSGLRLARDAS